MLASSFLRGARTVAIFLFVLFFIGPGSVALSQTSTGIPRTAEEKEQFLLNAEVKRFQSASKGITGTYRVTLTLGDYTHDASVQTIDEYKNTFTSRAGTELRFKDTYKFNIAAYRLDRLLELNMIPVTVERKFGGSSASFTWWVDDVQMDEERRLKKKTVPPNPGDWNGQMRIVRVFDQLIYNVDRNLGNLLIDKDWKLWMIDHTRAFRAHKSIREETGLVPCERQLFEKLQMLTPERLKEELGAYVDEMELQGLIARRDQIVEIVREAGPHGLYGLAPRKP